LKKVDFALYKSVGKDSLKEFETIGFFKRQKELFNHKFIDIQVKQDRGFREKDFVKILSPGRVNIIGEHTDYNFGLAISVAIDKYIFLTGKKNNSGHVEVYSKSLNKFKRFSLNNLEYDKATLWINYIKGAVKEYKDHGYNVGGFSLVIDSNIPMGAGLSSSAALVMGVSKLIEEINDLNIDKMETIILSNSAENNFVGVGCGFLDQMTIGLGRKNNAIFLNFKDLSHEYIPFNLIDDLLLIVDSREERNLSDTEYNKRREECSQAIEEILKLTGYKYINSLSDVDVDLIEGLKNKLPLKLYKRARHVVSENNRVIEVREYLKKGRTDKIGPVLSKSHQSLKDDYEVSTRRLDFLVDEIIKLRGVHGARLLGAGFGGNIISIVKKKYKDEIIDVITEKFQNEFKVKPGFISCVSSDGTKKF
jgi:galactokinase